MWAVRKAATADRGDPLAAINRFAALRQYRSDQAKVAVYPDEPVVLNKKLETADAMPLNPDDRTRCHRNHRGANWGRKVNSVVECPSQRPVWQEAGAKWRRYARRHDGQK